jgi:Ca-activated chloride channel homolog
MKRKFYSLMMLVGLLTLAVLPGVPTRADGLLFLNGTYRQPSMSHINVTIKDKIATTTLEQTFRNTLDKQVSAVYVAPVPAGATVTSFAQLIEGRWVQAEVKSSEDAKAQYDAAASKGQDASLMSASVSAPPGADPKTTFQTQIVLPPMSERQVRFTYTEVLVGEVGLTRYTYPLSSTNLSDEPVGDLLVDVKIVESGEIRAVYSPSHSDKIEVSRADKNSAEAVYRAQNVVPSQNFELVYTESSQKFGLNMATYRDSSDPDGYFVLIAAPQLEADKSEVVQKDFVFVLDRSGSMQGPKFTQAKLALEQILKALNPGDRFNVIAFDDKVVLYSETLIPAEQRAAALQWVRDLPIGSGTNINDGLLTALATVDRDSNRPHIVVFLTDGQATTGVTATTAILGNVRESIRPQSRVYTIGVGDVNKALLESLAQENRGTSLFVTDSEPLEKLFSSFYAAIDSPVLVDLALDFGGVEVYDMHPNPLPDMFLGGQVVLTGRYKGGGLTNVTLTGNINGQKHTSSYKDIKFIADTVDAKAAGFVPRLWAQRKVETLVRDLSINGPDPKKIEEVKALGLRYQIVTPYTSFVVTNNSGTTGQPVGLPRTGLPFLYVDDYRTVNSSLMVAGAALTVAGLAGLVLSGRVQRKSRS